MQPLQLRRYAFLYIPRLPQSLPSQRKWPAKNLNRHIESLINKDYCHVSEYLSSKFLSDLQNSIKEVENEVVDREKGTL